MHMWCGTQSFFKLHWIEFRTITRHILFSYSFTGPKLKVAVVNLRIDWSCPCESKTTSNCRNRLGSRLCCLHWNTSWYGQTHCNEISYLGSSSMCEKKVEIFYTLVYFVAWSDLCTSICKKNSLLIKGENPFWHTDSQIITFYWVFHPEVESRVTSLSDLHRKTRIFAGKINFATTEKYCRFCKTTACYNNGQCGRMFGNRYSLNEMPNKSCFYLQIL